MTGTVSVDRAGLAIDGRPFYLLAGCVHYFRWPRAEWRALLEQARHFGLNTIDTVIPWNRHEPRPGRYDFVDEADLGAFLDICHELGLKAIVRPGPYICAEWENGGLPAWLTAEDGLRLRVDDERYLAATLRWFDALMPVIAPRQHTRGGPVILCQIENEHWASTVYAHDEHQISLARAASERGVEVPQYTCMGGMPGRPEFRNGWSGIAEKLAQTRALWPENPMIVSELWSGWFDNWGASRQTRKSAAKLDITLHQLAAVGSSGFSHWMWAGGSNFGYWGGRTVGGDSVHMTTSYDYDAPISEFGVARSKAYVARRHHLFLSTLGGPLARLLADAAPGGLQIVAPAAVRGRSEGGAQPYRTAQAGPDAPAAWRDFRCTFLQNPGLEGTTYQIFLDAPARHLSVDVEPTSIRPIFCHLPLGGDEAAAPLTIVCHSGRILGFWERGHYDELVLYGQEGEQGEIELASGRGPWRGRPAETSPTVRAWVEGDRLRLRYWLTAEPGVAAAEAGGRPLVVQLLTEAQAERYGLDPVKAVIDAGPGGPPVAIRLPVERHAVAELSSAAAWVAIERPLPMERLGCELGYGWYRAELELDAPLDDTLAAPTLCDRARLILDGSDLGVLGVDVDESRYSLPLRLGAGRHDLRILADNLGRFNYGANLGERKGLLDTLYLGGAEEEISGGWAALWQEAAFAGDAIAGAHPRALRPDRADVHLGHFAFEGPTVWLLREIDTRPGRRYVLHLTGDRNAGALFVNGVAVERFSRHRSGGLIRADISALLRPGQNVLALNIQGYAGAPWRASLLSYDPARPLPARWSFRGGVNVADGGTAGQPGNQAEGQRDGGTPAFYRAVFGREQIATQAGAIRLRLGTLGKGQIWLNQRNVGRFWQVGPQEDYKLPASWLQPQNELLIFAETGAADAVTLVMSDA